MMAEGAKAQEAKKDMVHLVPTMGCWRLSQVRAPWENAVPSVGR